VRLDQEAVDSDRPGRGFFRVAEVN
jgi:hypothetical protein